MFLQTPLVLAILFHWVDREFYKQRFLTPFVFIGFYLGIKVVERINNDAYRKFILFVTGLGAIFILFK